MGREYFAPPSSADTFITLRALHGYAYTPKKNSMHHIRYALPDTFSAVGVLAVDSVLNGSIMPNHGASTCE